MSTEINIKKRIDIQEEGVSITPDVNSINFVGDGVTASAIGNDVIVNVPGGMGTVTYYLNESVTQAPYKEFTSILTASAEQTILTSVASGATVTVQSFQTPSGVPGTTNIPGGRWAFYLHFSGTTGDSWDVFTEVYKRDLGGIETLLLTTDAVPTSTLTGTAVMLLTDGVFPASTVLTTDRIVVKVRVTNTDVTTNSITFHTEGSTNYSIATTTLNQVIPTGAVTSVTGTAPIASSGGTTPAISISQSGAASDGYLSSTDWNTFNNKVDDNIYTADGTVTGTRIVDLNGNTIKFDDGSLGINTTPSTALHVNALAVPAGEAVARFGVTDSSGYAQIANGTGTNNVFAPLLQGRQVGTSLHPAIGTEGIIDPVDDTGTTPITLFKARLSNFTSPVTRPLFQFTSWTFDLMTMLANGNVGIGTATPTETLDVNGKTKTTTFQLTTTPTVGHVLTSDASGNGTWQANGNGTVTSVELSAGTGISLAGTNPITSSGIITVTNSAPDQTVVLNAGTGIGVTGTYPNFTISNTDPTTGVTLTSAGGSQSLVNDGTGPTLAVKGLSAGGGIFLAPSVGNDFISILNTSPASSVTLTSSGGTETLVNDGTGPSLATKGITAGTGISLSSSATDLTVTNAAPDQVVVLTAGTGINVTGIYPNFTIANTVSDTNIYNSDGTLTGPRIVTLNGNSLTFTNASPFGSYLEIANSLIQGGVSSSVTDYTDIQVQDNQISFGVYSGVSPKTIDIIPSGISINGEYQLPNLDGTAGQVMTTDGLGNVTFQTPSSGTNIYNSDGTLTTDRIVDLDGKLIAFQDTSLTGTIFSVTLDNGTKLGQFTLTNALFDLEVIEAGKGAVIVGTTTYLLLKYVGLSGIKQIQINDGGLRINGQYYLPNLDGTAGQVMTTDGAGTTSWTTPTAGSSTWNVTTQAGASSTAASNDYVLINAATHIVTLPAAANGIRVGVKMINATVTSIQIKTPSAGITIDGVDRSVTGLGIFNQYDAYTFVSDGTNWFIMG